MHFIAFISTESGNSKLAQQQQSVDSQERQRQHYTQRQLITVNGY